MLHVRNPSKQRRMGGFMQRCLVRVTNRFPSSQPTSCNTEHFLFVWILLTPWIPPPFLCDTQVWYLSGWVCHLQLEKAKEQQERDGRDVTEVEAEEWKALKEAARSYLTNAKKVIRLILLKNCFSDKLCPNFWLVLYFQTKLLMIGRIISRLIQNVSC